MDQHTIQKMNSYFKKAGIELTPRQTEQFALLHDLLVRHNDEMDLTRLRTFDDIIVKHFIDSIYFTRFVEMPGSLVDIGTGAGFPGLPLKIYLPGLHIILAEPRHKRVTFMEMAVRELGLDGVEIYGHLVTDKSFFPVTGVITRALESADETLTRVAHFLPADGTVILMKGPEAGTDLEALSPANRDEYEAEENIPYTLPGTEYARRILLFRKKRSTLTRTYVISKHEDTALGQAISSPDNKTYKELKKLTSAAGMKKQGALILSGKKIIVEALENPSIEKDWLIIHDGYVEYDAAINRACDEYARTRRLLIMKKGLYNELDTFTTRGPLLAARMPELPEWDGRAEKGCNLIIPFQDPQNVGAVIRSAVGLGVTNIIITREAAHPWNPKCLRSSAGTVFQAPLKRGPSLYDLDETGLDAPLITLDSGGRDIRTFTFPETFYLLPGIEGPGLPENLKNSSVSIPLGGGIDSLNASMAAAMALYEWMRQKPVQ